jgi:hypothetical protein
MRFYVKRMKPILHNRKSVLWLAISTVVFIKLSLVAYFDKSHTTLAREWMDTITGDLNVASLFFARLLIHTIMLASLSLLFGWCLQWIILRIARVCNRHKAQ